MLNVSQLREIRQERGMSLGDLAAATGLHPSTISKIENGQRWPRKDTLERMAKALGYSLELYHVE